MSLLRCAALVLLTVDSAYGYVVAGGARMLRRSHSASRQDAPMMTVRMHRNPAGELRHAAVAVRLSWFSPAARLSPRRKGVGSS